MATYVHKPPKVCHISLTLTCVILISSLVSCAPTTVIPPAPTERRFASTPPEARQVPAEDEFAREVKTLTKDIRQQIQTYHQISEDVEAQWSRLSDLAHHPQFKSVTARVNAAFKANSHAERMENFQKISAHMSPEEQQITYGYLKWFQEVSAIDKRFAALDERQGNLRQRAQDVRVRGAVILASGVSPTQQAYYLALFKVLGEEIEDLNTASKELGQQLKKNERSV